MSQQHQEPAGKVCHVQLSVDRIGHGSIMLDGVDLSFYVSETIVRTRVGEPTEMILVIPAAHVTAELDGIIKMHTSGLTDVTTEADKRRRFVTEESLMNKEVGEGG